MPVTSNTIVNRAIQLIGDNQTPVTGEYPNFDNSAAGDAANSLYAAVIQTVGRLFGWDFSRNMATLVTSGGVPPVGWAYEWLYPTNGIQVRQIMPSTITDANDPLPVNWSVGNINSGATKVIWTNLASPVAVFSNQPTPDVWDSLFTEQVVRMLASELAMATGGKPDTAAAALESANQFGAAGAMRDS